MKYCIYLKGTEPPLNFLSGEHIFPAGIGGIQKLPIEYVSHECNNAFSKIELKFMRNSIIAISRQFLGPGKRGSLSPTKATKSDVIIMNDINDPSSYEFGYVSLDKTYTFPQLKVNISHLTCHFITDPDLDEYSEQITSLIEKLKKFEEGKYILHKDEKFNENEFILGFHDDKWHVGLSNKEVEPKINGFVDDIIKEKEAFLSQIPSNSNSQQKVHQTVGIDEAYYRICAKIVFNYLAYVKGQQFVLKNCFDPLRNWVVNGGINSFSKILKPDDYLEMDTIPFPKWAHKLIIIKEDTRLKAYISFYGSNPITEILLCDNLDEPFEMDGYICDWENRKEYSLTEFLDTLGD